MKFPHVVVDGSNIATEGRDLPSLAQLDEAVTSFLDENDVELLTVVVDATFGHRIQPDERPLYETAIRANEIVTPPAGVVGRGDTFVLQVANRANATVLSNDSFQEFHGTYEWLFEDNRLIGGKPIPGLGWVFVPRVPVRGAISRKAVQDAKKAKRKGEAVPLPGGERDRERDRERRRDRNRGDAEPTKAPSNESGRDRLRAEPKPPKNRQDRPGNQERGNQERPKQERAKQERGKQERGKQDRQPRQGKPANAPTEFINEFLPFIDFVGAHAVGTTVNGIVERFTSHGAYLDVRGVRCYVPLKSLGSPTPRSARDVLDMGATYAMRVETIDTPRRGIDVTIVERVASAPSSTMRVGDAASHIAPTTHTSARVVDEDQVESVDTRSEPTVVASSATRTKRTRPVAIDKPSTAAKTTRVRKAATRTPSTDTTVEADHIAEEAQVTPAKKAAAKKATAKKAPAKKAAVKKAVVKKAVVKKAPAKKAPATKAVVKKAPAKKAAAKKAPATKAVAKKAPATKAVVKKAPAKKAVVKKAPAKKAAVKKAAKKK